MLSKINQTFLLLTRLCEQTEASLVLWFSQQTSDKCVCGILPWLQEQWADTRLQGTSKKLWFVEDYILQKGVAIYQRLITFETTQFLACFFTLQAEKLLVLHFKEPRASIHQYFLYWYEMDCRHLTGRGWQEHDENKSKTSRFRIG